jgi:hypothetical protein
MPYNDPSTPSGLNWEDINGRLLLINIIKLEADVPTTYGPKNAIRADIAVLDGPDKGTEYVDTLVFPTLLVRQLERFTGSKVVARLGQGEKKPGQKPPWKLAAATDDEKQIAAKYEAYRASQTPTVEELPEEEPF